MVDTVSVPSNASFLDLDLDQGQLGGTLEWLEPEDRTQVTHYLVYYAALSDSGSLPNSTVRCPDNLPSQMLTGAGNEQCRQELVATVSVGTHSLFVPSDKAFLTTAHFLVYATSSLVEQTTPAVHSIVDALASVSAILFTDQDLRHNKNSEHVMFSGA